MSVWNDVKESLEKLARDVSTLEVNTFTGDITSVITEESGQGERATLLNWEELIKKSKEGGTIKLAASTKQYIDGDQNQYFANDISQDIKEVHQQAVESGALIRQSFVRLVKDILD